MCKIGIMFGTILMLIYIGKLSKSKKKKIKDFNEATKEGLYICK